MTPHTWSEGTHDGVDIHTAEHRHQVRVNRHDAEVHSLPLFVQRFVRLDEHGCLLRTEHDLRLVLEDVAGVAAEGGALYLERVVARLRMFRNLK